VAAVLRKGPAKDWIRVVQESTALIGGAISIMHTTTYQAGIQSILAIRDHPERIAKSENLDSLLKDWTSPLTTASLINNRDSPEHRDTRATYCSMDVLASTGKYENGKFTVPGLGLTFWYRPGTVIGLLGRIVRHGATAEGERMVYTQYLRETVLETLGVPEPGHVNISQFLDSI
jgi:hypothetical protein